MDKAGYVTGMKMYPVSVSGTEESSDDLHDSLTYLEVVV